MVMEQKKRMLLEGVLGVLLIAFLVLASIMVVSAYDKPKTTMTNPYNQNSFSAYPYYSSRYSDSSYYVDYPSRKPAKPYIVDRRDYGMGYYDTDYLRYYRDDDYSDRRYLKYDDYGNFKAYPGIIGNRVDSYEVYVRNREYAGGYFKTVFYFEDYYGNIDSKSMTNYIPARDEKRFVIKDVSPPNYKYRTWWYDVVPLTKTPKKTNYNEDFPYNTLYYSNSQPRTYSYRY